MLGISLLTDIKTRMPAGNSSYPKVAVKWLNQALCFYQSFCLVDRKVLRNAKRFIYVTDGGNSKMTVLH